MKNGGHDKINTGGGDANTSTNGTAKFIVHTVEPLSTKSSVQSSDDNSSNQPANQFPSSVHHHIHHRWTQQQTMGIINGEMKGDMTLQQHPVVHSQQPQSPKLIQPQPQHQQQQYNTTASSSVTEKNNKAFFDQSDSPSTSTASSARPVSNVSSTTTTAGTLLVSQASPTAPISGSPFPTHLGNYLPENANMLSSVAQFSNNYPMSVPSFTQPSGPYDHSTPAQFSSNSALGSSVNMGQASGVGFTSTSHPGLFNQLYGGGGGGNAMSAYSQGSSPLEMMAPPPPPLSDDFMSNVGLSQYPSVKRTKLDHKHQQHVGNNSMVNMQFSNHSVGNGGAPHSYIAYQTSSILPVMSHGYPSHQYLHQQYPNMEQSLNSTPVDGISISISPQQISTFHGSHQNVQTMRKNSDGMISNVSNSTSSSPKSPIVQNMTKTSGIKRSHAVLSAANGVNRSEDCNNNKKTVSPSKETSPSAGSKRGGGKSKHFLPSSAVQILKAWFFEHLEHPYPSSEEKEQLSQETGLTYLQVSNWFTNTRKRVWAPSMRMISQRAADANPANSTDG